jgi:hypothetical protein
MLKLIFSLLVTLAGAVLFLLFGLGYGYEALLSFSASGHDTLDPTAGLPTRPDSEDALYGRRWKAHVCSNNTTPT